VPPLVAVKARPWNPAGAGGLDSCLIGDTVGIQAVDATVVRWWSYETTCNDAEVAPFHSSSHPDQISFDPLNVDMNTNRLRQPKPDEDHRNNLEITESKLTPIDLQRYNPDPNSSIRLQAELAEGEQSSWRGCG
jgi:hypothetical protein